MFSRPPEERIDELLHEYESMYLSTRRWMIRNAYQYVHDIDVAEDIVQECWLHLWLRSEILLSVPKCTRNSYIKQCVRNACIDYLRKNNRVQTVEKIQRVALAHLSVDHSSYAMDNLDWKELLDFLPKQEKTVVNLLLGGYSVKDIATMMRINTGTVRCYQSRACKHLKSLIDSGQR